jgi:hypothetical protein
VGACEICRSVETLLSAGQAFKIAAVFKTIPSYVKSCEPSTRREMICFYILSVFFEKVILVRRS